RSSTRRNLPSFPTRRSSDLGDAKDQQSKPHGRRPLATDPPGDVERDLVGGAVEGRADRRRSAVGRSAGGEAAGANFGCTGGGERDRKSTRLNSSHDQTSYAV